MTLLPALPEKLRSDLAHDAGSSFTRQLKGAGIKATERFLDYTDFLSKIAGKISLKG